MLDLEGVEELFGSLRCSTIYCSQQALLPHVSVCQLGLVKEAL